LIEFQSENHGRSVGTSVFGVFGIFVPINSASEFIVFPGKYEIPYAFCIVEIPAIFGFTVKIR